MDNKELENMLQCAIEEAVNEMCINSDTHDFYAQVNIDVIDGIVTVGVNYVNEYENE